MANSTYRPGYWVAMAKLHKQVMSGELSYRSPWFEYGHGVSGEGGYSLYANLYGESGEYLGMVNIVDLYAAGRGRRE